MEEISLELQRLYEENAPKLVSMFIGKNKQFIKLFGDYEDMGQTLLLKLWEVLPKYSAERGKFSTFCCKCCYNECLMKIRKESRKTWNEVSQEELLAEGFKIEDTLSTKDLDLFEQHEKASLLEAIKPMLDETTSAYYLEDLKQVDIAKQEGIAQTYVSRKIKSNLEKIRNALDSEEKVC